MITPEQLAEVNQRVRAEAERFRHRLPELLLTLRERWIVFRDDAVASDHDTEEEAYVAGIERFGVYGGHVVACVREQQDVWL